MPPVTHKRALMSAESFLAWADDQEDGRYELIEGTIVAMAPAVVAHARRKALIFDRLRAAIVDAGLPCEAFIDGPGVQTDADSLFIPDGIVSCGDPIDGDEQVIPNPIIIVEVRSPSTSRIDSGLKLQHYFTLASVEHYLLIHATRSTHVHHRRTPDGWSTHLVGPGPLRLDPPGITIDLD